MRIAIERWHDGGWFDAGYVEMPMYFFHFMGKLWYDTWRELAGRRAAERAVAEKAS